jgi:hypothetical protein
LALALSANYPNQVIDMFMMEPGAMGVRPMLFNFGQLEAFNDP